MTTETMDRMAHAGDPPQAATDDSGSNYCPSCGVDLFGGAKFCHRCGTSVDTRQGGGALNSRLLTVVGAAAATLAGIAIVFVMMIDDDKATDRSAEAPFTVPAPTAGQPPDLSTMTPREAADRLFNRVMMANEQGNVAEAMQFAPMAIQAYDMLSTLDLDALYHVGRLNETIGDLDSTAAMVAEIRKTVPNHLLASLLEHNVAVQQNDDAKATLAAEAFLDAYDEELAQNRREYNDHSASLEKFRDEAKDKLNKRN